MWPSNGFGNNLPFQNNFNQEDFTPPSPFGNANASPGTPLPGQHLFPHGNMMPFGEANGEGFANDFHPEVGLFNEGAFMQNQGQFMSPQPQVCVVLPRHPSTDFVRLPALVGHFSHIANFSWFPSSRLLNLLCYNPLQT